MKKSLLALAVLGAFAGAASAQSSVTLFGVVDLSVNYQKAGAKRLISEDSNQLSSNRIGFKGVEDLGGGLKAGFWLEAGMSNDVGTGAATGGGLQFNRRSTVSLIGNFGEVRIGRDYTPTFWNTVLYDAYGANGIGEGDNLTTFGPQRTALGSGATSTVRSNNSVAYWLPSNIGGFYGRALVGASEGASGAKYYGGSLNWAGGPFDIGAGYSTTKVFGHDDYKVYNAGASYDFGVAKIFALYNVSDYNPRKLKTAEVSVGIPVGLGAINASYAHAVYSGGTPVAVSYGSIAASTAASIAPATATDTLAGKGDQVSAQYLYNISKRTTVYGTVSYIRNRNGANFAFGDVPVLADQSVKGANVGIRHSF